jgi:Uma2 family endonuclease
VVMPATAVSAEEYERIALTEPERLWELHGGRLLEKPPMTMGHDLTQSRLVRELNRQLDPDDYEVQFSARLKVDDEHYFIPDICVVPSGLIEPDPGRRQRLNVYGAVLPLVVEIWSPSTGRYDMESKLPEYERQGHIELWRVHPIEQTLTARRRRAGGEYEETVYRSGTVRPATLPDVEILLEVLFK